MPQNKYFCTRPFEHIFGEGGSSWNLCCRSSNKHFQEYTFDEYTPEEWFYSDIMENIRLWIIHGKDPYNIIKDSCKLCHDKEKQGVESDRLFRSKFNKDWPEFIQSLNNFKKGLSWKDSMEGRILDVKVQMLGNYCNFSCFACQPRNSSTKTNELKKLGLEDGFRFGSHVRNPLLVEQIKALFPYMKRIYFMGGEPLLTNDHLKIIREIIHDDIEVQYSTNLSKLSDEVINTWKQLKNIKLNISIDGYGKRAEYARYGLIWKTFLENVKRLDGFNIEFVYATSIVNIMHVQDDYLKLSKLGKVDVNSCIVTHPNWLSINALPKEFKNIALNKINIIQLEQIVNTLNSNIDDSHLFPKALDYIRKLDKSRGKNILDHVPEFKSVY